MVDTKITSPLSAALTAKRLSGLSGQHTDIAGSIPARKNMRRECVGKEIVEEHFGKYRRDKDGDLAFSMHRQIHKATSNHGTGCCTCNRSGMLAGEPAIEVRYD